MKTKKQKLYKYHLIQDNIVVASVESFDQKYAKQEIMHYATTYSQDGPVTIVEEK